MKVCPHCGLENPSHAESCAECDADLSDVRERRAAQPETTQQPRSFRLQQPTPPPQPQPQAPAPQGASRGLKNAILLMVLIILIIVVVVGFVTCGGCLSTLAS